MYTVDFVLIIRQPSSAAYTTVYQTGTMASALTRHTPSVGDAARLVDFSSGMVDWCGELSSRNPPWRCVGQWSHKTCSTTESAQINARTSTVFHPVTFVPTQKHSYQTDDIEMIDNLRVHSKQPTKHFTASIIESRCSLTDLHYICSPPHPPWHINVDFNHIARLLTSTRRCDHITVTHRLPVQRRAEFKTACTLAVGSETSAV